MTVLVTGGAGYIGSFMTRALLDRGYDVIVFDNLKRGHQDYIDSRAKFVKGDLTIIEDLNKLFEENKIDAVLHFAGLIAVGESEKEPELYYKNNVDGSKNLFKTANKNGVRKYIFSSTAAVYGNPQQIPIPEDHAKNPTSEYGKNKLDIEHLLENLAKENDAISFAALRYFNASGAALDGSFGENHDPETHIIPLAMKAVINDSEFGLFGADYDTPDGTCIRDYIHVLDLVEAHILALNKIENENGGFVYNVGTGNGYSNREVIAEIEKISGKKINVVEKPRREGDADRLVADASKIMNDLGFSPKYSDLTSIVKSAWAWHSKQ